MTSLQDICHLITDGKHGDCQNEEGSDYYFISCKDVKDGWIDYSAARQITEVDYRDTHRRTQLESDDILITNSGTIGRMALVPHVPETGRTTFQKSVAIIKPNCERVIPRWLYYCLKAEKDALIAWAGGTAQKNLLLRDLRAYEVQLPPLPTQHKIASILSAYDDLIENNLRRIKILEEMAQTIYREWFVKFRFPGHEKTRMVDSPMGKIPDGWDVTMLGELVEIQKGKKPKTLYTVFEDGLVPYLLIDVMKGGDSKYTNPEKTVMAKLDDIVMIMDGASSGIAMIGVAGAVGSTLARFRPFDKNALSPFLLLLLLRNKEEEIRTKNVGSAIPHANKDYITSMEVSVPTEHINKDFDGCCRPLFSYILNLSKKNVSLRRTRDLLLPKLISGELDVSDLDVKTGGHMQ